MTEVPYRSEITIATAHVDITPTTSAKTARNILAKPSDEPQLEANILVFLDKDQKKIALIGLDTTFSSDAFEEAIYKKLPDRNISLVCIATHSHNTPLLFPYFAKCLKSNTSFLQETAKRVAETIIQCYQSLEKKQVNMTVAAREVEGSVYRRKKAIYLNSKKMFGWGYCMLPSRKVDIPKTLELYVAKDNLGEPQFALWSWPCHPTGYPHSGRLSGDYPAYIREVIRKQLGSNIPIVFFPGLCGDIRPDITTPKSISRAQFGTPFNERFGSNEIGYKKLCAGLETSINTMVNDLTEIKYNGKLVSLNSLDIPMSEINTGATPKNFRVRFLNLCGIDIWLFGAEVCSGYIQRFKPYQSASTIMSGCAGEVWGYLPTDKQISEGGYEPIESQRNFPINGPFLSAIEDYLVARISKALSIYQYDKN